MTRTVLAADGNQECCTSVALERCDMGEGYMFADSCIKDVKRHPTRVGMYYSLFPNKIATQTDNGNEEKDKIKHGVGP